MRPAPGRSPSRSRLPQQIGSVRVRASDHAPASTTTLHGVAVAVSIGDTTAASAAAGGVHAGPWARFEVSHDEDGDAYDDDEIQTTIALGGTYTAALGGCQSSPSGLCSCRPLVSCSTAAATGAPALLMPAALERTKRSRLWPGLASSPPAPYQASSKPRVRSYSGVIMP